MRRPLSKNNSRVPETRLRSAGRFTEASEQTREIIDQIFVMSEQAGTAMMPAVGDEITLFYREEGDQKVATRIRQTKQ